MKSIKFMRKQTHNSDITLLAKLFFTTVVSGPTCMHLNMYFSRNTIKTKNDHLGECLALIFSFRYLKLKNVEEYIIILGKVLFG